MTTSENDSGEFITKISHSAPSYKYDFKWSIENISKLPANEVIRSPEFSPVPGIKLCGQSDGSGPNRRFRFVPCIDYKKTLSKQNARFISTICDKSGKQHFTETRDLSFTLKDLEIYTIFCFTDWEIEKILPLKDDTLVVSIKIEFYDVTVETSGTALSQNENYKSAKNISNKKDCKCDTVKKLSRDILNMYLNSIDSDVVLRVGGKDLRANKTILRLRSKVFSKMFEHRLVEDKQNVVDIQDVSADIMNELLLFVYSGEEKTYDYNTAYELFYAADKYEINDLRQICCENLVRQLSPENVFDVLHLADRHHDDNLKSEVVKYAVSNFRTIASSDEWIKFAKADPVPASEIVIKSSGNISN